MPEPDTPTPWPLPARPVRPSPQLLRAVVDRAGFGGLLRQAREHAGLSLRALETRAAESGDALKRDKITQSERGQRLDPDWVWVFLRHCDVPASERVQWVQVLQRVTTTGGAPSWSDVVEVGRPPRPADHLQPRPAETAALERVLGLGLGPPQPDDLTETSDGASTSWAISVATSVLSGLGGVGKSQLAGQFYRTWCALTGTGEVRPAIAMWVSATSRDSIVIAYADAARAIGTQLAVPGAPTVADDPERAAHWLLSWLARTQRRWLVVLDDLADPRDLRGLWPTGLSGAVLVTTRRTDHVLGTGGRTVIPLGLFAPEQSRAYLTGTLPEHTGRFGRCGPTVHGDVDDAGGVDGLGEVDGLAEDLQHLPLALAQAAVFILDRGLTFAGYRARFADRRRRVVELFPDDAPADDYQHTVAAVVALSLEAADALSPAGLARPVLELAALLDPSGIPLEVLTSAAATSYIKHRVAPVARDLADTGAYPGGLGLTGGEDCRDAVHNLARLSLLTLDRDTDPGGRARAVQVHALVQRATRDTTPDFDRAAAATANALDEAWTEDPHHPAVAQAFRDNTTTLATHSGGVLWHPDGHPVLFQAGTSLGEAGQVAAARDYWVGMVTTAQHILGPDHTDALGARDRLARWRGLAGDPAGAADAYSALLDDLLRVLGPDHPDILVTRGNLADWQGHAGNPAAAADATAELLAGMLRVFGPDHPHTLTNRHSLAFWHGEAGDPAAAADATAELLDDQLRVLGPDHPETLTTRSNLAYWRGKAGDFAAAAEGYSVLLDDRLRVLGPDHPDTLAIRSNLAGLRGDAGDPAAAVDAHSALFDIELRVLGPDHPDTLGTRGNIARWRGHAGDPVGAADAYYALLDDRLRVLGPDHPDTLGTRGSVANWRGAAGDPGGAADALAALLDDQVRVLGPDHPDTLGTRHDLVRWRGEAGDPVGAADATAELLDTMLRVLGSDHPDTLTTRHNLAYWRGDAGDPAGAADALATLLDDQVRVLGPDHPDTLGTRHNLANWRGAAGDPAGAADALATLLDTVLRVLGPDHPDTLGTRSNLARWHGEAGDPVGAADATAELLDTMLRVLGPDHPDTLTTRHNLASWRGEAGDPAAAADAYSALLDDRLRVLGPDHPGILAARRELGYWRNRADGVSNDSS